MQQPHQIHTMKPVFTQREPRLVSPAIALAPLGAFLFYSSYEAPIGPVALNLELVAICFAWFVALLRRPALNPLLRFLSYFAILGVGVAVSGFRTGDLASPLYFVQSILFMSVALLPGALRLTGRDCRLLAAVFLAFYAVKLALINLSVGAATSNYDATTPFSFTISGRSVRRAAILNFHSNAFALLATLMTLYSLYLYLSTNRRFYLILHAAHVAISAHIILLTFSRSGFIAFVLATLLGLLAIQYNRSSRLSGLLAVGGVLIGAAALMLDRSLISFFFEERMMRFAIAAADNPRIELALYALREWTATGLIDWFFGSGFMHYYTDSTWPAILFNLGLIGVVVTLAGIWSLVNKIARSWRARPDATIVLLAVCLAMFVYGFSTEFWAVRKVLIPASLLFGLVHHDAWLARRAETCRPMRKRASKPALQS